MSAGWIDVRIATETFWAETRREVLAFQVSNSKAGVIALLQTVGLRLLEARLKTQAGEETTM